MCYLSRQEKICVVIFFLIVFTGLIYKTIVSRYPHIENIVNVMDNEAFYPKVNINTVDYDRLNLIPGIGEYTASRIISYRDRVDEIKSLDEIAQLPGIYPENFKRFKPYLAIK